MTAWSDAKHGEIAWGGRRPTLPARRRITYDGPMDALLAAIVASPADDTPRLVWADREGGERGELVVIQCAIARGDVPHADRLRLAARAHELLSRHGRSWDPTSGLLTTPCKDAFVRGFVEHADVPVSELERIGAPLFARAPLLRSITVTDTALSLYEPFLVPPEEAWTEVRLALARGFAVLPMDRVTSLTAEVRVHFYRDWDWDTPASTLGFGDDFVGIVADAPPLRGLTFLGVYEGALTERAFPHLARLASLERLALSNRGGDDGMLDRARAAQRR